MDTFALIAAERRSLADLLDTLTPAQLLTPSLCDAWTVRQVAGHLAVPLEVGLPRFALAMLCHAGDFDAANDALARRQTRRPFAEVVQTLREKADSHFTPPRMGPEAPLTDVVVHGLDITRPLGLTREYSPEVMRIVLDHVVTPQVARRMDNALAGLRVEATDLDWAHGTGPVLRGSAQSILLALTGRPLGLEELQHE